MGNWPIYIKIMHMSNTGQHKMKKERLVRQKRNKTKTKNQKPKPKTKPHNKTRRQFGGISAGGSAYSIIKTS